MTVLAWDGKTLAADRRATMHGGLAAPVTKIWRIGPGKLAGTTGDSDTGRYLKAWYLAGAVPADFPEAARDSNSYGTLVVISADEGISHYACGPYPMRIEAEQWAWGIGRDFALAAMYMGADARQAVEVACEFHVDCGNGIDTLTLESDHETQ